MKENNNHSNNGAAVLVTQIRDTLEDLGRLTDDAAKSEQIQNYLEFSARFHNYSFGNQILILLQCPDATHVAGFRTWQSMGRSIRKGSQAIRILAPMIYKRKKETKEDGGGNIIEDMEEKEVVRFFRPVCVFDISQTMGDKPLPGPDIRITGDTHKELLQPLLQYIKKQDIVTVFRKITGGALGYTTRNKPIIVVDNTLSPDQQIETLLHETAHQLLHQNNNSGGISLTREEEELEASAVAYVVCQHHHLDTKNPNYLALWNVDAKKIKAHMERITGVARRIIQGIEKGNT